MPKPLQSFLHGQNCLFKSLEEKKNNKNNNNKKRKQCHMSKSHTKKSQTNTVCLIGKLNNKNGTISR